MITESVQVLLPAFRLNTTWLMTLSAYWKLQSQSQSQSQNAVFQKRSHKSSKTESRKGTGRAPYEDFSEEEIAEQVAPLEDERFAPSGPPPESRRQTSPELEKVQPLFLDDDDDAGKRHDTDANAVKKPPSKSSSKKPKKPSRRVVVHQDSEDEGATFKGFRGRK
jgi:hypothetical protein